MDRIVHADACSLFSQCVIGGGSGGLHFLVDSSIYVASNTFGDRERSQERPLLSSSLGAMDVVGCLC